MKVEDLLYEIQHKYGTHSTKRIYIFIFTNQCLLSCEVCNADDVIGGTISATKISHFYIDQDITNSIDIYLDFSDFIKMSLREVL